MVAERLIEITCRKNLARSKSPWVLAHCCSSWASVTLLSFPAVFPCTLSLWPEDMDETRGLIFLDKLEKKNIPKHIVAVWLCCGPCASCPGDLWWGLCTTFRQCVIRLCFKTSTGPPPTQFPSLTCCGLTCDSPLGSGQGYSFHCLLTLARPSGAF